MPQNSTKSNIHQLDLLEEKQAYVVIALTDKLSREGKDVAFNCLAHYNSKAGYSWASIPTIAEEIGLSNSSTKAVARGLTEIEQVGAFKIIRGTPRKGSKKSSTHHCCPVMSWFRAEYKRLQKSGKFEQDNDEFEDVRDQNRSGSQPDEIGSTARLDRAHNPVRSGSQPEEENRTNRTERNEQNETKNASGGLPAVSSKPKVANDNARSSWPENYVKQFIDAFTFKTENKNKIADELDKARSEGVPFSTILAGATEYSRVMKLRGGDGHQYATKPENWLKGRCWRHYQPESQSEKHARIKAKVKVAI